MIRLVFFFLALLYIYILICIQFLCDTQKALLAYELNLRVGKCHYVTVSRPEPLSIDIICYEMIDNRLLLIIVLFVDRYG